MKEGHIARKGDVIAGTWDPAEKIHIPSDGMSLVAQCTSMGSRMPQ